MQQQRLTGRRFQKSISNEQVKSTRRSKSMSLITDKVFYNALRSNTALMEQVGGRIESTSIPVPDEQLDNVPVPYVIITFDGLQNDGFTKDNNFEGDTDHVQVGIEVAADTRDELGDIMQAIRDTVVAYFEDTEGHAWDDYDYVPVNYTFTASPVGYDSMKPCYYQTLNYNCDTNP
jgi:hypothetical protein